MNTKKVVKIASSERTLARATTDYTEAADEYAAAKKTLASAKQALLPLLGKLPSEGTVRIPVGDMTVVVRTNLTRRLDTTKVKAILPKLTKAVASRVLPVTRKLSIRDLRFLEDNDAASYKMVRSTFVVSKAAPTIKVEL